MERMFLLLLAILLLPLTARANEKVYLHLDQTAYFLGEKVWFCAYVNDTRTNAPTTLSRVLYVELVAPEGEVVESRVCRIEQGRASGCIELRESLLSGLFEIRAYTRYMMNWRYGENYYWRVIPIFNAVTEGHYEVRNILKRDYFKAKKSKKERKMREASERETSERISQLRVAADNITPLALTVDSLPTNLLPNQTVRLRFHGEPNATFSLSIADAESHIPTNHKGNIVSDLTRNHRWALSEHLSNRYPAPRYVATPERGITLRGFVYRPEGRSHIAGVPQHAFYISVDAKGGMPTVTASSDSSGFFQVRLGDLMGDNHTTLFNLSDEEEHIGFQLDKWFAPQEREFTIEEKGMLDDVAYQAQTNEPTGEGLSSMDQTLPELKVKGKRRHRSWEALRHSAVHFKVMEELEWQMDNTEDMAWLSQTNSQALGLNFGMHAYNRHHFPVAPFRQLLLHGSYPGDSVVPQDGTVNDWMVPNVTAYKEVVLRTDWPICEKYNFGRYSVNDGISGFKSSSDITVSSTGMYQSHHEKYPSTIMCYVPYAEGERRYVNSRPSRRHTFVHGYSYVPKFNERQPYRRTLYWNPSVTTDANGDAIVEFRNNATCREIVISAEGITEEGRPVELRVEN